MKTIVRILLNVIILVAIVVGVLMVLFTPLIYGICFPEKYILYFCAIQLGWSVWFGKLLVDEIEEWK